MAWQGQKDIQTSKYPHMALNLDVWDIAHSGNTVTFKATVRAIVTSGWISYNGVSVSLTGGGSISGNMSVSTGQYVDFGQFNCSINVPSGTTTATVRATLSAGTVASGYAEWTINVGSGGTNPSGLSIVYNSSTWNSINATVSLEHWGGVAGRYLEAIMVTGSSEADFNTITADNWYLQPGKGRFTWAKQTTAYSETYDMRPDNYTNTFGSPLSMKGMRKYYLAVWANNSADLSTPYLDTTVRYLPPAPGQFTYTDPGGSGTKTYPVTFTGVTANNIDTYTQSQLSRTIRYKINNGAWVYVDNATIAPIDFVSLFSVTVPAGSVATIEGWFTYMSNSEVTTITIANTNASAHFYSPLNSQAKETIKFYSPVNGVAKKALKIYASEGGVAKKVYEDV